MNLSNDWYTLSRFLGGGVGILVALLVVIGLFFLCREIVCWYWKINQIVTINQNIDKNIVRMVQIMENIDRNVASKTGGSISDIASVTPKVDNVDIDALKSLL